MDRRSFVGKASLVGLGLFAGGKASAAETKPGREIAVFTKYFEKLGFDQLAETIAPLGVAGLEAPLRKGGHIEPEEMAEKLPAFVGALAKKDLEVVVMASSISGVDKAGLAENQLRAAANAGIRRYRLEHLRYDLSKPIKPQVADFKARLTDLAALNREIGIQGLYQNHRGKNMVGGPIWDMVGMLEDIDVKDLGMAFDFAHATVEGANAWEMNFRRALPHIGAVYFKDYRSQGKKQEACPLGEGMVNPLAGKLVTKLLPLEIPVSIHIEYVKGGDVVKDTVAAMAKDLATLRKWLG
jgi:sugar phosphate isomerase/epimerase